jgi:DNA-directed RNA polymerase subunit RPC12/RpoP
MLKGIKILTFFLMSAMCGLGIYMGVALIMNGYYIIEIPYYADRYIGPLYLVIGYLATIGSPILIIITIIRLVTTPTQAQTKKKKKKNLHQEIKAIVMTYPKISMKDMAELIGESLIITEKMVLMMIAKGKIKAYIDPGTKDIISGMIKHGKVIGNVQESFKCNHCGALLDSLPVKGTSVKCASCGNLIVVIEK